jgi:hypothetical protein
VLRLGVVFSAAKGDGLKPVAHCFPCNDWFLVAAPSLLKADRYSKPGFAGITFIARSPFLFRARNQEKGAPMVVVGVLPRIAGNGGAREEKCWD